MTELKVKKSDLFRKEKIVAFLFILIPLIGFLVFTVLSMVLTGWYSFNHFKANADTMTFVGLRNYRYLFTNDLYAPHFKEAIFNTLWLMLSVPIGMAAGLGAAHVLNKKFTGSKFFRVILYLPAVTGAVAVNLVWRYIFNNEFGIWGYVFGSKTYWLADPVFVKLAIIIKGVWGGLGGTMLLFLAGMQNISSTYYEAADIDGATGFHKFFKITLPMLTPVTFYLLIMGLIGGFQSYADSQVFANGYQGARTIVYFIWRYSIFTDVYGIASAAAILLAIVIMIITLIQFKLSNKWVYED